MLFGRALCQLWKYIIVVVVGGGGGAAAAVAVAQFVSLRNLQNAECGFARVRIRVSLRVRFRSEKFAKCASAISKYSNYLCDYSA